MRDNHWGVSFLRPMLFGGLMFLLVGVGHAQMRCRLIDTITFTGNKRTKVRLLLQEMRLKPDSVYCFDNWQQRLKEEANWLYGLALFDSVSVEFRPLVADSAVVALDVRMHERFYYFPYPILSPRPYSLSFWWRQLDKQFRYLSYGAGLVAGNLSGMNDNLGGSFLFGNNPEIRLRYVGPYISRRGGLWGYLVGGSFERQRSLVYGNEEHAAQTFVQRGFRYQQTRADIYAGVSYRPQRRVFHTLQLGFIYRAISDSLHTLTPDFIEATGRMRGLRKRHGFGLVYRFVLDKRQQPRYPLQGSYFSLGVERYGLGLFSEINLTRLRFWYASYHELHPSGWYLSTFLRGFYSFPRRQAFVDRSVLNRGVDVRGYQRYFIQNTAHIHGNLRFRWRPFSFSWPMPTRFSFLRRFVSHIPLQGYVYIYGNAALVQSPGGLPPQPLHDRLLYGGGLGFELLTVYDFVLGVYHAFTAHGQVTRFYVSIGDDY